MVFVTRHQLLCWTYQFYNEAGSCSLLMPLPSIDLLYLALLMLKCILEVCYQYTHKNFLHTNIHETDLLQPILELEILTCKLDNDGCATT